MTVFVGDCETKQTYRREFTEAEIADEISRQPTLKQAKAELLITIYSHTDSQIEATGTIPGGRFGDLMSADISNILAELENKNGNYNALKKSSKDRVEIEVAAFNGIAPGSMTAESLLVLWASKHEEMRTVTSPILAQRRGLLLRLGAATTLEDLEAIRKLLT